jgi:hypothetical protein
MAIKLNIGDVKSKKTYQVELDEQNSAALKERRLARPSKESLSTMLATSLR